jgi:hypothetical protein
MGVVVGFAFMPLVDMVMAAVLPGMVVVMDAFPRAVFVGMLVLVGMFVGVRVDMTVAVLSHPRMLMFMLVLMGMFVGMVMVVFVVALHGCLLFAAAWPVLSRLPRRHVSFSHRTASMSPSHCCLWAHTKARLASTAWAREGMMRAGHGVLASFKPTYAPALMSHPLKIR